jgi:tetratricopeptide (TPR) repeat protein
MIKIIINLIVIGFFTLFINCAIADQQDVQKGVAIYEKADQLDDQGNHKAALNLYLQALQIFKDNLGSQNNYTASALNNIGGAYKGLGDMDNALKYYKSALSIREKVLGSEHHYTGSTIGNIATILQEKGDYEESLKMFNKAISIYNKTIGPDKPNTLILCSKFLILHLPQPLLYRF